MLISCASGMLKRVFTIIAAAWRRQPAFGIARQEQNEVDEVSNQSNLP
jgi:hypothetical protein